MSEHQGSCLCGKVKVGVQDLKRNVGTCHCNMCRKWTGGPFFAVECGKNVNFQGKEFINIYNSSDWAERGFCSHCGSPIFYKLKESQEYIMPVDLFDGENDFIFDHQIFIDEKPSYYSFSNKTSNMTGAEVFAKYTAPTEQP